MSNKRIEDLVNDMTLEEQVSLLSGQGSWSVAPIPRLGVGSLVVTDGPNGARGGGGLLDGVSAAAFPVGISLGSTWNPDLMVEIGAALAEEARDKGAQVLLGPTINLQRGPLNGRNFECFSEDPMLTGALAVGYVKGLQGNGVSAMPKHFIANESEIDRAEVSSDVDERTLRELYLLPFERAVKDGGAWAVMSSYNRLNGTFTSEHPWLLNQVLRQEWGFDGVVCSDWYGSHSTVETIMAGLDIEMPGPTRDRGAKLVKAVEDGVVPRDVVRRAALNVLRLMERCGALDNMEERKEIAVERPETRALIRRAGAEGTVLLKNKEQALPLADNTRIALVGPNVMTPRIMGGGSSQLNAHREVSIWDGMVDAVGSDRLSHAMGCRNNRFEPLLTGDITIDWFDSLDLSGPVACSTRPDSAALFLNRDSFGSISVNPKRFSLRLKGRFTPEVDGRYRIGMHCAGRARVLLDGAQIIEAWESWTRGATFFEEGCDPRTVDVELKGGKAYDICLEFRSETHFVHDFSAFYLGVGKPSTEADLKAAADIAGTADVAVVCVGRNGEWDTEGWDLPSMTLPGDQDELVFAVSKRAQRTVVVLQTGGPVEMPWLDEVDAVIQAWYPGQEAGHAIADVLNGSVEPSGRLAQSYPKSLEDAPNITGDPLTYPGVDGHVRYEERLNIGYRHHDTHKIEPLFPFGHGLGYSNFVIENSKVDTRDFELSGAVRVEFTVHNTGVRDGQAVPQLYVASANAPVSRPAKELKAFTKIRIPSAERETVTLNLSARDFAWFDVKRQSWIVSPGEYLLRLGFSAADTTIIGTFVRKEEIVLAA